MENNFDQLFKEKINSKNYPYSNKAWKSFSKKMGWKSGLSVAQSIVITTLTSLIIAAGGYFLYHQIHSDKLPVTSSETEPQQPVTIIDTILPPSSLDTLSPQETADVASETPEQPKQKTASKSNNITPSQPSTNASTDTLSAKKNTPKYILRPKNPRRILEINTDTIKSND